MTRPVGGRCVPRHAFSSNIVGHGVVDNCTSAVEGKQGNGSAGVGEQVVESIDGKVLACDINQLAAEHVGQSRGSARRAELAASLKVSSKPKSTYAGLNSHSIFFLVA